jgi:predicted hydrocarbon binding protein
LRITKKQEEEIEKIRAFLEENNIKLDLTLEEENYIDYQESKIVVYVGQKHEHVVYTALHEIGHYFSEFIPDVHSHAAVVIEEVLAWDLGKDIGHTIGIDIDEEAWNELMIDCIDKYIKYPNI